MSLAVVGSIAFDAVKTPFGERERMLGGSAVHFSLASSFFTDVHVYGPVGDDFGDEEYANPREPRRQHRRNREDPGRQDLLLEGPLRVRPEHRPHRRHAAQRLRDLRAQAQRRRQGSRRALPGQHRAGPPARSARAVPGRQVRRARLDEPLDRHRQGLADRDDQGRRRSLHERRRDPRRSPARATWSRPRARCSAGARAS